MSEKENDKLDKILSRMDEHSEELQTIRRGIYGDKENGVPGLLANDKDQEKRLKSLEEFKKKIVYTVGGITLVVPPFIQEIKKYFGL